MRVKSVLKILEICRLESETLSRARAETMSILRIKDVLSVSLRLKTA